MKHRSCKFLAVILACSAFALAQDLASFEKRITVKKLDNGLTVVIYERQEAPVFALRSLRDDFAWQIAVGSHGARPQSHRCLARAPSRPITVPLKTVSTNT